MGKKTGKKSSGGNNLAENRKARFEYEIVESFEAGIVLTGNEIKSIRNGGMSLNEAYVRPRNGELWLQGAHVTEYAFSNLNDYNPTRARKLLMHRSEIMRLIGRVEQKGLTLVPLKVYLKGGRAKLQLALARGKKAPDKRRTIQDRDQKREAERAMKS